MVSKFIGALSRAMLVVLLILAPALALPTIGVDTAQIVLVVSLLLGILTFIEYFGRYPSIVEFRFAGPYNRIKFFALSLIVLWLTVVARGQVEPSAITLILTHLGQQLGQFLDFPFSPVRLVLMLLPQDADPQSVASLRIFAGVAFSVSFASALLFFVCVKLLGWPMRNGAFNVWVNLPMFDPTRGDDIVDRLKRDASFNLLLGALLPFLIPVFVRVCAMMTGPLSINSTQALIWMVTLWALLPASILIRGIALLRVAELVEEKRRRVYAKVQADGLGLQEA